MSLLTTGVIHFSKNSITQKELDEISFKINDMANRNRIGINIYSGLSFNARHFYPINTFYQYLKDGDVPYELVDSPASAQCEGLYNYISYSNNKEKTSLIEDISKSKLPNIQKFYEELLTIEEISIVTYKIEDIHMGPPATMEYAIKPNEFCDTIKKIPNNDWRMPSVLLQITR